MTFLLAVWSLIQTPAVIGALIGLATLFIGKKIDERINRETNNTDNRRVDIEKDKFENDEERLMRKELRDELDKLKADMKEVRKEVDYWRDKYYALVKENAEVTLAAHSKASVIEKEAQEIQKNLEKD